MCITDPHDMTLAVKVALNPYTTNQTSFIYQYVLQSSMYQCYNYNPQWATIFHIRVPKSSMYEYESTPHTSITLLNSLPYNHDFLTTLIRGLLKTLYEKSLATFDLSSANAFNLIMSKILSFGKGLNKGLLLTFEDLPLQEYIAEN